MILILGVLAAAQPTYLQCRFEQGAPAIDVIADEANSSVTVSLSTTGYTEKMPAAFTATEVRFQGRIISYVVDRTNLSATRTIKSIQSTANGKCEVQKAPKRAF